MQSSYPSLCVCTAILDNAKQAFRIVTEHNDVYTSAHTYTGTTGAAYRRQKLNRHVLSLLQCTMKVHIASKVALTAASRVGKWSWKSTFLDPSVVRLLATMAPTYPGIYCAARADREMTIAARCFVLSLHHDRLPHGSLFMWFVGS